MKHPISFSVAPFVLGAAVVVSALASGGQAQADASSRVAWAEHFNSGRLDWVDPFDHGPEKLARVYTLKHEGDLTFLNAHADASASGAPPAMHYGRAFQVGATPLENVRALTWKWRAHTHPSVGKDAWEDMAAGVYVVVKTPSLLIGGKGFKFGWLAKPGEKGTHQHGLLQVEVRHDGASDTWQSEAVDLCGLFRQEYGACEGEKVLYVGVVTDADGSKSVADADYSNFELLAK